MSSVEGNPSSLTFLNCRRVTITMWIKPDLDFQMAFDEAPHEMLYKEIPLQ